MKPDTALWHMITGPTPRERFLAHQVHEQPIRPLFSTVDDVAPEDPAPRDADGRCSNCGGRPDLADPRNGHRYGCGV